MNTLIHIYLFMFACLLGVESRKTLNKYKNFENGKINAQGNV